MQRRAKQFCGGGTDAGGSTVQVARRGGRSASEDAGAAAAIYRSAEARNGSGLHHVLPEQISVCIQKAGNGNRCSSGICPR
jgi:hypothetical protein